MLNYKRQYNVKPDLKLDLYHNNTEKRKTCHVFILW